MVKMYLSPKKTHKGPLKKGKIFFTFMVNMPMFILQQNTVLVFNASKQ